MDNELEKLDAIKQRLNVSYADAKSALEEAEGDVIQALVLLEERQRDIVSSTADLASEIARLAGSEPARRMRIKLGNRVVADVPVALTAVTGLILGLAAVFITKAAIELEREDETPEGSGGNHTGEAQGC